MRLENAFTIDAPVDEVWSTMLDLERVAACVPGSQVIGPAPNGGLEANTKIKVGPMAMTYRGTVVIVEQDAANRRAVLKAKAREAKGQGTAEADMVMEVHDRQPVEVTIATDLDVTGRVAQMGRGVMQDVAGRIIAEFAKALQAMVAGREIEFGDPGPAEHADAPAVGPETPPPSSAPETSRERRSASSGGGAAPRLSATTVGGPSAPAATIGVGSLGAAVARGRFNAVLAWLRRVIGRRR